MKQTILTLVITVTIIALMSAIIIGSLNKNKDETNHQNNNETNLINSKTPIFFYGNTCPHCSDVEDWMKENNIEQKITIIKKEVYANRQNAEELTQVAQVCGLPTNSIGVPFLYAEGKCLVGTPDIISYLSKLSEALEASESAEINNL